VRTADADHVTRDPNREEVHEGDPADPSIEESTVQRRLVLAEGRQRMNTDAIPTQPLRCIRIPGP
jgi:hypothetical protein